MHERVETVDSKTVIPGGPWVLTLGLVVLLAGLVGGGCGDDDSSGGADAAVDGSSGLDAALDAGTAADAVGDASTDRDAGQVQDAGPGLDGGGQDAGVAECDNWQQRHPEWIFCDDFESHDPLVGPGRYFEYGDDDGDCRVDDGVGLGGSRGLSILWQAGEVEAGGLKLAFGRNPQGYMNKGIRPNEDFREIYYRMYLRNQPGWQGSPAKLSRATVFVSSSDWSQAMIAHLWSHGDVLLIDPASCVDANGNVMCQGYNDFGHLNWLGNQDGTTPIFATDHSGRWFCIEAHVKLNDPGQSNGLQEFWIDGHLEARRENLNFVGTYQEYAINAVFFENYWNNGSPVEQGRTFDNIVVSTTRIGCL